MSRSAAGCQTAGRAEARTRVATGPRKLLAALGTQALLPAPAPAVGLPNKVEERGLCMGLAEGTLSG